MSRIYYYELRRLASHKVFWGMLIVIGVFAWFLLGSEILMGIGYTAPYSGWSYGAYLCRILPLMVMSALLLLAGYYSDNHKKIDVLTGVTPTPPSAQILLRAAAVGTFFLLDCAVVFGIALVFFGVYFGVVELGLYLLLSLFLAGSGFVFFIGLGLCLGKVHKSLIYLLCLVVFALGFGGFESALNPFPAAYFATAPTALIPGADGEVAFVWEIGFWAKRAACFGLGALLIWFGARWSEHKEKRA